MSIQNVTLITISCDVCDERFEDDEGVYHLKSVAEFIEINGDWDESYRWSILPDGYAVCPDEDESHGSVRESLEKFLPQPEIPGQVAIPAPLKQCCCEDGPDWDCYPCVSGSHTACPERETEPPAVHDPLDCGPCEDAAVDAARDGAL